MIAFKCWDGEDGWRLSLFGDIDLTTCAEIRATLSKLVEASPARTELDLRDVTFLDCAGIGALAYAHEQANRHGRTLTITRPHGIVCRVLELTNVMAALTPVAETSPRPRELRADSAAMLGEDPNTGRGPAGG
jgi:anti-anti-sigma factor